MAAANGDQPEDRHIVLRIGVNLGDVMVEGSDSMATASTSRPVLRRIAEPGGILVSGTAYDHVRNKVKVGFDDLGAQTLKNIAEPVRAYRVTGTPPCQSLAPKPATDKPSIAVLPFTNMSGDPEQEYFSDGITEDIITELSRVPTRCSSSPAIRHSSFKRQGRRRAAGRRQARRALCRRGQRAQGGQSHSHHGAADRCCNRKAICGQSAMIATWRTSSRSRTR